MSRVLKSDLDTLEILRKRLVAEEQRLTKVYGADLSSYRPGTMRVQNIRISNAIARILDVLRSKK